MIGRRGFTFGLGATLLAGRALAQGWDDNLPSEECRRQPLKKLPYVPFEEVPNHRAMMRDVIGQLSDYCHKHAPRLSLVARGAPSLIVRGRREWEWLTWRDPAAAKAGRIGPEGSIDQDYLEGLDGLVIDGMFSGYAKYGEPTRGPDTNLLMSAARAARKDGKPVFLIEYGPDKALAETISQKAAAEKFLVWFDQEGDKRLARLPKGLPSRENPDHIRELDVVRNFFVMLRSDSFHSRAEWVSALAATNYDMLVLDPFWNGTEPLTRADLEKLKMKRIGTRRLVLACLPLGCAREGAYYWKPEWQAGNPSWLVARDPKDPTLWVVEYWDDGWKAIVGSYIESVAQLGFDGVMLDHIDAYLPFEDMMPID